MFSLCLQEIKPHELGKALTQFPAVAKPPVHCIVDPPQYPHIAQPQQHNYSRRTLFMSRRRLAFVERDNIAQSLASSCFTHPEIDLTTATQKASYSNSLKLSELKAPWVGGWVVVKMLIQCSGKEEVTTVQISKRKTESQWTILPNLHEERGVRLNIEHRMIVGGSVLYL